MKNETPKFDERDYKNQFATESSFKVIYPSYQEKYINDNFPAIESVMGDKKIAISIDKRDREITIRTTEFTRDPFVIVKANDFIKLISRNVPVEEAEKIFQDEMFCEIIKINSLVSNKTIFEKRRDRLIGKDDNFLKAIKMLSKCYILVYKNSVCVIGSYSGVRVANKFIFGVMKNIHPAILIKNLIVKSKLDTDPELVNEDWDRYLPPITKTHSKSKKIDKKKKSTPAEPFRRKIDADIESGEYFKKKNKKTRDNKEYK